MGIQEVASVVIIAALPFLWTLEGDFVFDDLEAVQNNPDVKYDFPETFYNIWKHDFWGADIASNLSHKSYRPLTVFTFRWNKHISGNKLIPSHFKITNLLIHIICSVLTYITLDIIINKNVLKTKKSYKYSENIALLSTFLFAVHPVHVEVVSGIVGRADSLAAIFFLLCILCYEKSLKSINITVKSTYFCVAFLCCAVSMLFKESGITALAVCAVYDIFIVSNFDLRLKKWKRDYKIVIKNLYVHKMLAIRLIIILLYLTILLLSRWAVMGFQNPVFQEIDNPAAFSPNFFTRVLTYNYIYFLNSLLLIWPQWLCFDWSMGCISLVTWSDPKILLVVLFWLCLCFLMYPVFSTKYSPQFQRNLIMTLSILILPFLPASNIFFTVGFVLAERVLYIPSIGFCTLVALGFYNISQTQPKIIQTLLSLGFLSVILIFGLRSMVRSREWQNQHLLFGSGLEVCPQNAKVHYNIGKNAGDVMDMETAEREYRIAIALYPEYYQAMNNLANLLKPQEKYDEAESLLIHALNLKNDFPTGWMNLGILYCNTNEFRKAEHAFSKALSLKKYYPNCHYNLGILYLKANQHDSAINSWLKTIELEPDHNMAWNNLLALLDRTDQLDRALSMAPVALAAIPDSPSVHFNLANIYGKKGDNLIAEKHFKEAIRLRKDDPLAIHFANFGVLYHRWGKMEQALQMYRKALEINPTLSSARENIKKLTEK